MSTRSRKPERDGGLHEAEVLQAQVWVRDPGLHDARVRVQPPMLLLLVDGEREERVLGLLRINLTGARCRPSFPGSLRLALFAVIDYSQ